MNLSPDEAESALADIDRMVARTRRAVAAGHWAQQLVLWGVVWMLGFGASQFLRVNEGFIWGPLSLTGAVVSWWIGFRDPKPIRGAVVQRIGLFFLTLAGFAGVWAVILHPFNVQHFGAYVATVFMFAYVVGGIWFGRFFIWLGLGVTAAAVTGVLLLPQWLNLWMALAGGGSLVASGLYIRRAWR